MHMISLYVEPEQLKCSESYFVYKSEYSLPKLLVRKGLFVASIFLILNVRTILVNFLL